ncbi:MAG: hypothetical protein KF716_34485 [Anaerolineae bacterium]|nr:hypothetical protein [Anaerolineae bacterium]
MVIPYYVPCLEPESVLSALEAMRQGKKLPTDHPLAYFLSVRYPHSLTSVEDAVVTQVRIYNHLSRVIHAELNHHRSIYQLNSVVRGEGSSTLEEDFQTSNEELQAWSLLYHRYVRVDLNLPLKQIETIVKVADRTLNRRQDLGIFRLTNKLLELEIHERIQNHKLALRQHLPPSEFNFVDREQEIEWAVSHLCDDDVRRIMLAGPSGIGKTGLAIKVSLLAINQLSLQNVAWIDQPSLIPSALFEQIIVSLGLALDSDPRATLQTYLARTQCLIVIDNAHDIIQYPLVLESVLRCLNDARLILCTRTLPMTLPAIPISTLSDLDQDSVYTLFDKLTEQYPPIARKFAHLEELYNRVGGNPGALREEFSAWYGNKNYRTGMNRFSSIWPQLSADAQLTWITLALVSEQSYRQSQLAEVLQNLAVSQELSLLWQHGVITLTAVEGDIEITLASLARTYIELLLDTADADQRTLVVRSIKRLADYLAIVQDGISCVRMLKASMRITLPPTSSLDLAHTFVNTIERTGQWTVWIDYLTMLLNQVDGPDRFWVLTRIGVANRQLGHSEEAAYYLTEALEQAGVNGNFAYQIEALIELSVLFRSRLNYAAARQLLLQAKQLDQRYQQSDSQERIELERAQLVVAEQKLASLPTLSVKESTPHLLYLTAQVELLEGHFDEAMTMALSLHEQMSKDDPKYPRVVALLGRIHFEREEWDSAVNETSWAIEAMEAQQDVLASVHTKINLALMYIQQQRPHTALKYLQSLPMGYW